MKLIFTSIIIYFFCQIPIAFAYDSYSTTELESVKKRLAAHPKLKILDSQSLEDLAIELLSSRFQLHALELRLTRFLQNGDLPFAALEKAISAEETEQWHMSQLKRLSAEPDSVVTQLQKLTLKPLEKQSAQRVYALCIEPLKYHALRLERFSPRICSPTDSYNHTRHESDSVNIRTKPSHKNNDRVKAYNILVQAGKDIIESKKLEDLEILLMAKCIAEKSLKFKVPIKYPIKACHESLKAPLRSPESALFQGEGVCSNISGVAYNMAKALGFKGPIFFARHHLHVFLETHVKGEWLHFHPLASYANSCDFVRFK
jgi:hypothetical protein